jgi:hypothetical protein
MAGASGSLGTFAIGGKWVPPFAFTYMRQTAKHARSTLASWWRCLRPTAVDGRRRIQLYGPEAPPLAMDVEHVAMAFGCRTLTMDAYSWSGVHDVP